MKGYVICQGQAKTKPTDEDEQTEQETLIKQRTITPKMKTVNVKAGWP